ncbi:MAG TPA: ABC transporter ATP-binding protein [Pyrinomonadaceae bacterium]|jgi:ABC-type polysaccharide/polyol phosphate transport system ATPase subunit
MTTSGTAIAFEQVVKNFRHFASPLDRVKEALHPGGKVYHTPLPVLRNLTFTIPKGEAVAVLGPNGVGKSTLLHLIAGVIKPSSGTVTVSGSVSALLDLAGDFAPELTGRENVRFFHDILARGRGELAATERFAQSFADIGEYFDRPVRTYSSGMLLRLGFAAALAMEPDILLIDEVIAVGDALFQQKCFRRIREVRERGATILLVTHMAEMVLGLCDRVLLFDHGELTFDGDPAEGVGRYYQLFFKVPGRQIPETSQESLRHGAASARLIRSFATRDGINEESRFARGEVLTIVMEVEFEHAVMTPHFGFNCATKEAVRVYGTSTVMLGVTPSPASARERRRVEFSFRLSVVVSELFIDLSVFELRDGSVSILDARLGALHLSISSTNFRFGIADLDATFIESTLEQRGTGTETLITNAGVHSSSTSQETMRLAKSAENASGGTEVVL